MPIAPQTLRTLEFTAIRERLVGYAAFSASKDLARVLTPSTRLDEVRMRLQLTSEARRLLALHPDASIGGARDVRDAVRYAARGATLEASTVLQVGATLRSMRQTHTLLTSMDARAFALLHNLAADFPHIANLEQAIERTIDDEGNVLDSASPELARLRRLVRSAHARLHEYMQHLITSGNYADVLQEPIVTVRDGRYVVPVRAPRRRSLPGLVHDQSGSGATLYIEPLAAVELNNEWREAQLAEHEEVQRILAELSHWVGQHADDIVAGIGALALFDLALAQARYAYDLRASAPHIGDYDPTDPRFAGTHAAAPLLLKQARHPLLDPATAVPVDLWLGNDVRLLLITGPNTGGKTVALKTAGLLALMAQAGLHIPANDGSRLPLFGAIFADIGDEQSIAQSLSTFSSHMTNIISILHAVDAGTAEGQHTLVLLDELGAGTDPVEGSALARAIAQRLLDRACLAICTTHYAELKVFAANTPGVQNGSVEFDVETLAPTYRLTIGLPGRSNALAIARRLGLDDAIIAAARDMLNPDEMQLEDLLGSIRTEREATERERAAAEHERAVAEDLRVRYEHAVADFEGTVQQRLLDFEAELEAVLRTARHELRRNRSDNGNALAQQWAQQAEQRMRELQQQAVQSGKQMLGVRAPATTDTTPDLNEGSQVMVPSLGLTGEILSIDSDDDTALVQVGGFRVEVGMHELRRANRRERHATRTTLHAPPPPPPTPDPPTRGVSLPPPPEVAMSLDMRGWRVSEVDEKLDAYLNDAFLAGLPSVRLIHGKGSGALRQAVRDVLRQHPLIDSYTGGGKDGGEGVTIARMNQA